MQNIVRKTLPKYVIIFNHTLLLSFLFAFLLITPGRISSLHHGADFRGAINNTREQKTRRHAASRFTIRIRRLIQPTITLSRLRAAQRMAARS